MPVTTEQSGRYNADIVSVILVVGITTGIVVKQKFNCNKFYSYL